MMYEMVVERKYREKISENFPHTVENFDGIGQKVILKRINV
jgi:hypothetical protein